MPFPAGTIADDATWLANGWFWGDGIVFYWEMRILPAASRDSSTSGDMPSGLPDSSDWA